MKKMITWEGGGEKKEKKKKRDDNFKIRRQNPMTETKL